MVNTGKPSQGCGTCRARRIKCDERKPTCFRCQKSKRECTGYRDTAFVRMRWDRSARSPTHSHNSKRSTSPSPTFLPTNYTNDFSHPNITTTAITHSEITAHNRDLVRRSFSNSISSLPSSFSTSPTSAHHPIYGQQPLPFQILVSPTSALSTPIEDQAKCLFRKNFVLEPCEGNSRSYMRFLLPVLEHDRAMWGPDSQAKGGSRLGTAVMAVALALIGNRYAGGAGGDGGKGLMGKAMKCYSRALKEINDALLVEEEAVEDDTLAAILVLGLFEILTGTSGQPSGWISHADGAAILVKMRDQKKKDLTDLGRVLHVMARSQLVVNCLVSCSPPILGVTWWMRFGTKDNLPTTCARLNLEVATIHARMNDVLTHALKSNISDLESVLDVLKLAKALESEFKAWEDSLPPSWRYRIIAWIEEDSPSPHSSPSSPPFLGGPVGGSTSQNRPTKIEERKAFPGRVDTYADISIATAFNMMRASRIILAGDIVRASAWLCPSYQDYRTMPEYATAVRVSKELIEDIVASVPFFLGGVPDAKPGATGARGANGVGLGTGVNGRGANGSVGGGEGRAGDGKGKGRQELVGTSALGLFVTWPLMMVKMSDYSTGRQRRWAMGRLSAVAYEMGIGQAALFSHINVLIPSMFITRDETAQIEGVEVSKRKCMETAMAGSVVQGKEMEHMIAGVLGCR